MTCFTSRKSVGHCKGLAYFEEGEDSKSTQMHKGDDIRQRLDEFESQLSAVVSSVKEVRAEVKEVRAEVEALVVTTEKQLMEMQKKHGAAVSEANWFAAKVEATQTQMQSIQTQLEEKLRAAEQKIEAKMKMQVHSVCCDVADLRDLFEYDRCRAVGDSPEEQTRTEEQREPQAQAASEPKREGSTQQRKGGDKKPPSVYPARALESTPKAAQSSAGGESETPTDGAPSRRDPPRPSQAGLQPIQSQAAAACERQREATKLWFEPHPDDAPSRRLTLEAEEEILDALRREFSHEEKKRVIRNVSLKLHPDKGGTKKAMQWLGEWKKKHQDWFLQDYGADQKQ